MRGSNIKTNLSLEIISIKFYGDEGSCLECLITDNEQTSTNYISIKHRGGISVKNENGYTEYISDELAVLLHKSLKEYKHKVSISFSEVDDLLNYID